MAEATFVAGAEAPARFPAATLPEIAFAGRSNAGKSALLNRLLGRRGLARVSKTPGRTQQINFFRVEERFLFVDLPGYGFARVPETVQRGWRRLVEGYLTARRDLRTVVLIVDVRRGLEADDLLLTEFLDAHGIPIVLAVNKIDKLSRGERSRHLASLRAARPRSPAVAVSARTGEGVDELWKPLREILGAGRRGRAG
jgi:GTP-binding protein